jgi:hypothetical protein
MLLQPNNALSAYRRRDCDSRSAPFLQNSLQLTATFCRLGQITVCRSPLNLDLFYVYKRICYDVVTIFNTSSIQCDFCTPVDRFHAVIRRLSLTSDSEEFPLDLTCWVKLVFI